MFKIGQMVRVRTDVTYEARAAKARGAIATITEGPIAMRGCGDYWELDLKADDGNQICVRSFGLVPIDDGFKSFMERVLKPVDLGQPVTA